MNKIIILSLSFLPSFAVMADRFYVQEDKNHPNKIILKKVPKRSLRNKEDLIAGTLGVRSYLNSYSDRSSFNYLLPKDVEEVLNLHLAHVVEHNLLNLADLDAYIQYSHPELLKKSIARLIRYFQSGKKSERKLARKLKTIQEKRLPTLIKMVKLEAKLSIGPEQKSAPEDEGYQEFLENHKIIMAKRAFDEARFRKIAPYL